MRRAAGAKAVGTVLEVLLEDRLQNQQRRHLNHPVAHRRNPQRAHLPVGFRDVHAPDRPRLVGMAAKAPPDFVQKGPHAPLRPLDRFQRHPIHSGSALIGPHPAPCRFQHVLPADVAVERIETELRLILGLAAQILSQSDKFRRQGQHPPNRVFRSRILVQSAPLPSYRIAPKAGPLRSTVVTRFPATMGPSDSRQGRAAVMSSRTAFGTITPAPTGLPGSSADLSARAVPSHPGRPDGCLRSLLRHRRRASPLSGGLATLHWCNEAETGSLALRLARSLGGASTRRITPQAARVATC